MAHSARTLNATSGTLCRSAGHCGHRPLSAPLEYLLATGKSVVLWGFAGAIVGTLPALMQTASSQTPTTLRLRLVLWHAVDRWWPAILHGDIFSSPANFWGFVVAVSGARCWFPAEPVQPSVDFRIVHAHVDRL